MLASADEVQVVVVRPIEDEGTRARGLGRQSRTIFPGTSCNDIETAALQFST
jgi:hypothetical protein